MLRKDMKEIFLKDPNKTATDEKYKIWDEKYTGWDFKRIDVF